MRLAGFACRTGQPGDITAPGAQTCVKLKRILTGKPLASFPIARRCPSYHIFDPSRGNEVIDCRREVRERRGLYPVSVPSRGNGVIDCAGYELISTEELRSFRPLSGKWGYRFTKLKKQGLVEEAGFPSPLGEMGLSIMSEHMTIEAATMFPSPLGEMGLSITSKPRTQFMSTSKSFRPLSGKWGYRSFLLR